MAAETHMLAFCGKHSNYHIPYPFINIQFYNIIKTFFYMLLQQLNIIGLKSMII